MLKKMLLVLDGQTGVLDREIHKKNQIISNINLLIDKFDTIQQPILFTRHTNKTSLVAETGSWELVSTIRCPETPIYFNKKRSNIFAEENFIELLKRLNIQTIYICGFVTNGCVQAACLESQSRGFETFLLEDAHSTFVKNAEKVIDSWNQKLAEAGIEVSKTHEAIEQLAND